MVLPSYQRIWIARIYVKVEHKQLGLLGAVATAHRAHQLRLVGADTPNDTAGAAAVERNQIANKFAGAHVPQLHGAVVGRCYHKTSIELKASYGWLVFEMT